MGDRLAASLTARRAGALARALLARASVFVATLSGALFLVLALFALAPGDAIDQLPNADEVRPVLAAEWHLDQPLPVQYVSYLADILRGDLRTSIAYRPGQPVAELIANGAPRSLGLVLAATLLAMVWGTGLGWLTARRGAVGRRVVQAVSVVPVFLAAHLFVGIANGATWALIEAGTIARPDWFVLPSVAHPFRTALAITLLAVCSGALTEIHTEVDNALRRIRTAPYVDAARARGVPVWPHVALNLVGPLTAIATRRAAFFLGGLVIIEKVLMINGVGAMLWEAAESRDYPLALGVTLVFAAWVTGATLLGDATRTAIDPRLRSS